MLPVRGATRKVGRECPLHYHISIHAPRAGSDPGEGDDVDAILISIHAPRAGSDSMLSGTMTSRFYFNPCSPCGERLVLHFVSEPLE